MIRLMRRTRPPGSPGLACRNLDCSVIVASSCLRCSLGAAACLSEPLCLRQAMRNRQNPLIHSVFQSLFHYPEMYVSVERYGIMRPTKGLRFPGQSELVDRPAWKTKAEWVALPPPCAPSCIAQ